MEAERVTWLWPPHTPYLQEVDPLRPSTQFLLGPGLERAADTEGRVHSPTWSPWTTPATLTVATGEVGPDGGQEWV